MLIFRGTQREYNSKQLKHSIVKRILVFKSNFLKIPRMGVQDGKIEIPQTLSATKPFVNYFIKYKTQFVWLNIFETNHFFFNFHLREAFKPPKNVLGTLASWMEMETNTITFLILNNFTILPFYLNVVRVH